MKIIDLTPSGPQPFVPIWQLQKQLHQSISLQQHPATLVLVEHEPVYTAGARTNKQDLAKANAVQVLKVDRGGRITWHGPGQITVYAILRLAPPLDVIKHVRLLEQAVIDFCHLYNLTATTVTERSGVWVHSPKATDLDSPLQKICAVGCRVAKSTTMHGIGLNVNCDLSAFHKISPCGIDDAGVTSLQEVTGKSISIAKVKYNLMMILEKYISQEIDFTT